MSTASNHVVDLPAYLRRIEYVGELGPTAAVLAALHRAHVLHVPFENLDIQLGRPILLDLDHLVAKLVGDRRGGYCFEQNTLFAAVLEQIGFRVTRLSARVRFGTTRLLARTHMLLRVDVDGLAWLADVGFGAGGLLEPVPLRAGPAIPQHLWSYRLVEEEGLWVLQALRMDQWEDYYAFTLEPQFPVDFELASYFTSTHPSSIFVKSLTVQSRSLQACTTLRNRELTIDEGGEVKQQQIEGDDDLLHLLATTFGLPFPPGTRFRCLQASHE